MPVRVQRSRTSGWRTPPNTVYVGRPTRWGNPWIVWPDGANPESYWCGSRTGDRFGPFRTKREALFTALEKYRAHALALARGAEGFKKLRGKNLACWCPLGQPCHADVLLELANQTG